MNSFFTTMRRVFVCFLEEIEDSKKAFRNYLTFRARPDWAYEFPDRTGRTPKFARQVLPDQTKSGLIFSNILHTKYELLILLDKILVLN